MMKSERERGVQRRGKMSVRWGKDESYEEAKRVRVS